MTLSIADNFPGFRCECGAGAVKRIEDTGPAGSSPSAGGVVHFCRECFNSLPPAPVVKAGDFARCPCGTLVTGPYRETGWPPGRGTHEARCISCFRTIHFDVVGP